MIESDDMNISRINSSILSKEIPLGSMEYLLLDCGLEYMAFMIQYPVSKVDSIYA